MANEKSVEKITLTYDDGSQREISKGFIADVTKNKLEGSDNITFNLVGISDSDLELIVYGVLEFAKKIGMFGDTEDADDEES